MLTVDVNQLDAQLVENGYGDQTSIDTADILSIQINLTLDDRFLVIFHAIFFKPGQLRNACKNRTDGGFGRAGTNHVTVGALTQYGGNRINHNGFTGTRFTGQHVKATVKGNVRAFDDRDILNMQKTQHGNPPENQLVKFVISPQSCAAALLSRITTITVSSPARVPTTTLMFMASMAEAAALARPGSV